MIETALREFVRSFVAFAIPNLFGYLFDFWQKKIAVTACEESNLKRLILKNIRKTFW